MPNLNIPKVSVLLMMLLFYSSLTGQDTTFNEKDFFKQIEESYYSLSKTKINNFTALLTNYSTEDFAEKQWKNSEIFPLQLIWLSTNRVFLSEQGVPALSDSAKAKYNQMVLDLKEQITGILFDLKRFYLKGLYNSISSDYRLRSVSDLVEIKFLSIANSDTTYYTYYLGKNGLCFKIVTENPGDNTKVETYPHFRIVKTKWLISDWEVQINRDNKIETGIVVNFNSKIIDGEWAPSEIVIAVQHADRPGETFTDVIKFRNFLSNQPLQIIEQNK